MSLIIFSWLAFTARRNFGPYAMVSAPVISRHLHDIIENWESEGKKKEILSAKAGNISNKTRNWINLTIIVLLVIAAGWKALDVNKTSFVQERESDIFPSQAVDILLNENDPGKIFNEYNWGGYLVWRLQDYQVFIDGRTDLYGDEIIGEWSDILNASPGWENKLNDWNVNYMLVRSDWPVLLVLNDEWREIYSNDTTILLKHTSTY